MIQADFDVPGRNWLWAQYQSDECLESLGQRIVL